MSKAGNNTWIVIIGHAITILVAVLGGRFALDRVEAQVAASQGELQVQLRESQCTTAVSILLDPSAPHDLTIWAGELFKASCNVEILSPEELESIMNGIIDEEIEFSIDTTTNNFTILSDSINEDFELQELLPSTPAPTLVPAP